MSDENYIEALKVVVEQTKATVAIAGVPLAILLSQMRVLIENQNFAISVLLTSASLSLFGSTVLAWYSSQFAQSVLAVEIYKKDGKIPSKGRKYLDFIHSLTRREEFLYTEEGFIALSEKGDKAHRCFARAGLCFTSHTSIIRYLG